MEQNILHVGLDVGSTTVKIVVMNEKKEIIYKDYRRHFSDTKNTICTMLYELNDKYPHTRFTIALTGSGAMSAAKFLNLNFIQEVVSCKRAVEKYIPQTDVVIELGGEDAKIIYFDKSIEQRMNGTCAGGTGAFIDQMSSLLNTDTAGLNELAKHYTTIYPIASRCGVFAKTDIQPLINEGAAKEDIAASIFQAVVNQTISGLACGRPIRGKVAFLGGPLTYLSELRNRFIQTLNLKEEDIIVPEEAHLLVATGAALDSLEEIPFTNEKLIQKIENFKNSNDNTTHPIQPLFNNKKEYEEFKKRHSQASVAKNDLKNYTGDCFIGIDAGSTTTKLVLIDKDGKLLHSIYGSNEGSPLNSTIKMLKELYSCLPKTAKIRFSGVTGYGEQLIQTALNVDIGEIETIAHYTAAKQFEAALERASDPRIANRVKYANEWLQKFGGKGQGTVITHRPIDLTGGRGDTNASTSSSHTVSKHKSLNSTNPKYYMQGLSNKASAEDLLYITPGCFPVTLEDVLDEFQDVFQQHKQIVEYIEDVTDVLDSVLSDR